MNDHHVLAWRMDRPWRGTIHLRSHDDQHLLADVLMGPRIWCSNDNEIDIATMDAELLARARVMATAPVVLDALERLVEDVQTLSSVLGRMPMIDARLAHARQAIAEARGL